jgi:Zn-dependent peptidase ImmA (M78 family)
MEVQPGTILIDISLIENENSGRLRFTLAHELAHWLIHQKIFEDSQQSAAKIDGNIDSQTEWQADTLAALILMPKMQIKKAFYKITNLSRKDKISHMAELFNVSKQAMTICLKSHNMI